MNDQTSAKAAKAQMVSMKATGSGAGGVSRISSAAGRNSRSASFIAGFGAGTLAFPAVSAAVAADPPPCGASFMAQPLACSVCNAQSRA